ncbi:4-hydroxy-3-methylbut-2-enyl diphosphate reductase [Streptomyces sp. SID13726]|uniref:4-hydroxy-3-methylbut-2-enyl diphosphate reductase n=1 Tax=Streptomyces sp. SID13726 TaxID=2706058 RepID=UPI0013B74771|nr:4-hydroxy-3-methylbut-2-enyl diphosphate reductase [Streptomyces sp. SID13726]NEB00385.1 4-hydroxy-3-methylbut-2-enyl diphosphate reductase [Streptomyces sp. SID13726]
MNRSVLSEALHRTVPSLAPGTVVVARSFHHPVRGPVDCPAHQLLAAHVRRAGFAADGRRLPDPRAALDGTPATVFTVSYEHPEGGHRGLALAARDDDPAALAFARRQLDSWRAVLRTRRVLYVGAPQPAQAPGARVPAQTSDAARGPWQPCGCPTRTGCPATRDAERALRRFLDRGDEVVVIGTPASGTWPPQHLLGPALLSSSAQAEGSIVGLPDRGDEVSAIGAPPSGTWPSPPPRGPAPLSPPDQPEHSTVSRPDRGDEVVVIGVPASGTWPSPPPRGPARVATPEQAEQLTVTDPDRLAFVVAPGTPVSEASAVLAVLRRRHPRLRGQHPQEWCYTMDDLHTALDSALPQSDRLLITTGAQSPDPFAGTALARPARLALPTRDVTALHDLRPTDVDGATLTVLDTTADRSATRALARALDGLGPTSHIRRETRSRAEHPHAAAHQRS